MWSKQVRAIDMRVPGWRAIYGLIELSSDRRGKDAVERESVEGRRRLAP